MIRYCICLLSLFITIACSRKATEWTDLKSGDCENLTYGRIDAKRLLTDEDIQQLKKDGLRILEFVLENQYLGSWEQKWNHRSLDKTPVKSLIAFESKEKLASGMQLDQLKTLSNTTGQAMVLIQTLAPVDSMEIKQFGKVLFHKDHFYRLVVANHKLPELLDYPCLRLMSIVKENYDPDKK
ncbi:MAG: hypothetical protein IPM92_12545 [Saprospiraceae bacterium]|nr:hypothetical protein [Saprospiraceae bacterium]